MLYIHFTHANGFPAKTYSILFEYLNKHKISLVEILGSNTDYDKINWEDLSEEIVESAKKLNNRVIGIGHSLGGVLTLLAASKYPKIFESVILLDPPLFSRYKRGFIKVFRKFNLDDFLSPARKSMRRRDKFDSKKQAFEYLKSKKLFKNFHPIALEDYIKHGLAEKENGFELKIPVKKEIAIYRSLLTEYPSSLYNVKGVIAYSTKNPILWKSDLNWIKKNFKKINIYPFPGTHFYPLENPESTANLINRVLKNKYI